MASIAAVAVFGGACGPQQSVCLFGIGGVDTEYFAVIGTPFSFTAEVDNTCAGAVSLRLDGEKPRGSTITYDTADVAKPRATFAFTPDIAHVGDVPVAFIATNGKETRRAATVIHVTTTPVARPPDAGSMPPPTDAGTPPVINPQGDSDGDGITDADEVAEKTNPFCRDTDHDGTPDGDERRDTDGDGLSDARENRTGDADGDGVSDENQRANGPQVSWARFKPAAVWNAATSTTRVEVMVVGGEPISRVALVNPYTRGEITVDGQSQAEIEMFDDGTHGDLVAGDYIYTRGGIAASGVRLSFLNGKQGRATFRTLKVTHAGGTATIDLRYAFSSTPLLDLIVVDWGARIAAENVDTAGTVRQVGRAVNIVDPTLVRTYALEDSVSARRALQRKATQDVARRYYQYFKDDLDWFYLISDEAFGMIGAYGVHVNVRNAVQGVGQAIFDGSGSYGSNGVLQGVTWINYSTNGAFLHETMHQWGVHLDPSFGFSNDSHWGNADVDGHIGGFSPVGFVDHGDGTYTYQWGDTGGDKGPYAKIELYLMGLIPKEEVPPIRVLKSPVTRISSTSTTATVRAAGLLTWTVDDIIAKHGLRSPGPATSQKAFRGAFVCVSEEPADEAFLTYISLRAEQMAAAQGDSITWSFAQATGSRATLDTLPTRK